MNITEIKTGHTIAIEKLIDFNQYEKTETGWNQFIADLETLFRDKSQTTRDAVRNAGGYKSIMKNADLYFETAFDTVHFVTESFNYLCSLKDADASKIFGDDTGYRYTMLKNWNERYNSFQYANEFTSAYKLVTENIDLLRGITC